MNREREPKKEYFESGSVVENKITKERFRITGYDYSLRTYYGTKDLIPNASEKSIQLFTSDLVLISRPS
jgi:hypothetical protein